MTVNQNPLSSRLVAISLLGIMGASALPYPGPNRPTNSSGLPAFMSDADVEIHQLSNTAHLRRQAPSGRCSDLTLEQAQRLAGWDKLVQYAKDTWGDGGWNIVVNPKEYPSMAASACIDDSVIKVQAKGKPDCNVQSVDIDAKIHNASGSDTGEITIGDSQKDSWSITKTSEFGVDVSFSVGFEVPELFSAETSISTSTKFTNSQGNTFETSHSAQRKVQSTLTDQKDSHCTNKLTVKSCTQNGEGKIRVAATGWVWFNYDDKRAPKAGPKDDKHYKWAANIDKVLSLEERSSFIEFNGFMQGQSNGQVEKDCKALKDKKPAPKSKESGHPVSGKSTAKASSKGKPAAATSKKAPAPTHGKTGPTHSSKGTKPTPGKPVSPHDKSTSPHSKPTSQHSKPTSHHDKPASAHGKPASTHSNPVPPHGKPTHTPGKPAPSPGKPAPSHDKPPTKKPEPKDAPKSHPAKPDPKKPTPAPAPKKGEAKHD